MSDHPAAPPPLPPAIFLMGPTASGKTDLAMALCDQLDTQLQAASGLSENLASAVAASRN